MGRYRSNHAQGEEGQGYRGADDAGTAAGTLAGREDPGDGRAHRPAHGHHHGAEGVPGRNPEEVSQMVDAERPKTIVTVEPDIVKRIDSRSGKVLPKLWIHYSANGKTEREPTGTTSIVKARKLRAKRMEQHGRGEPGRRAEIVTMDAL